MKLKNIIQIFVVIFAICFTTQSAFAIRVLGQNPFYGSSIKSADDVRAMILSSQADIEKGLAKVGKSQLLEPLVTQIPGATITEVQYAKGQTFEWMFFKKKGTGTVRVDKDVVWEADTPMNVYEFAIDHDGMRHTMAVPPVCGNLTLLGSQPIPPAVVAPPPGEMKGESLGGSPGSGADVPPVAPPAEPEKALAEKSGWPLLFDLAYMHQLDPAHHVLARIGTEYEINDNFSLIGMVGMAAKYDGLEGKTAFIADVFANYNFSRYFIGFGVGAWITDGDSDIEHEDNDFDLILNMGGRIFGEPTGPNTSFFVEIRSDFEELDEFDLYGKLGAGFRFRF